VSENLDLVRSIVAAHARGDVPGVRPRSANARHECFDMDASVSVKTAETAELDEREHSGTSTRTLPHRPGEASLRASHILLDPSVLIEPPTTSHATEGDPNDRFCSARLGREAPLPGDAPRLPRVPAPRMTEGARRCRRGPGGGG
jgi:hypothetical protein